MITKDGNDTPIMEVTKENFACPKGQEHLYHVKLEVKQFDKATGDRLSHPFYQRFIRKNFKNMILPNLKKQGYTVEILFDPEEFMNAVKAAKAKSAAELEAEKEKAMREKILAELEAEGLLKKSKSSKSGKAEKESEPETPSESENAEETIL